MKNICLLIFLSVSISTFAQITITPNDLPQAGVDYFRSSLGTSNIDVSETGANFNWDYADLLGTSQDTFSYDKVSETPIFYQFTFSNPLSPDFFATEAQASPDMDLGGLASLSENYLFSKQSSSEWTEIGIGTTISGIPFPTKYANIKTKLKLPLNFQNTNSDDYSFNIQVPTLGSIGQDGTLSYIVDGWGTLKLPGVTFDVLRVKTELVKSDTIYIDLLGFGLRIPSSETVYEWYAAGEGYPVLTIRVNSLLNLITGIEFSEEFINGVSNPAITSINKSYPNPATNVLNLELVSSDLSVLVMDISGQIVISPNQLSPKQIDVSSLPKGVYFIKLDNQNSHEILRFIKQ